ncbi:MAG: HAMP domain-containing histidine kinase, partial [Bacteroidetes bacterium]|nr:HAMP domain-containing histidine kinase [Bacteroidota bacterium]
MFIFYLLVAYVFLALVWWSYLLFQKNKALYEEMAHSAYYQQHGENTALDLEEYYESAEYGALKKKYNRQVWMIVGEGMAIILILLLGVWKIHQSFFKELALARQQKNFLLSITHELKSPLASIKLAFQTFTKRELEADKAQRLIRNSLLDVERLHVLLDNLLMATKIENHSYSYIDEEFDLTKLATQIVDQTTEVHGLSKNSIKLDLQENVLLNADKVVMGSVIHNLVENAIKYTENEPLIEIGLKESNEDIILTVEDSGIGIDEEHRERI